MVVYRQIKVGSVLLRTTYRRGDKSPVVTYYVLRTVEVIKVGSVLLRTTYRRGDKSPVVTYYVLRTVEVIKVR